MHTKFTARLTVHAAVLFQKLPLCMFGVIWGFTGCNSEHRCFEIVLALWKYFMCVIQLALLALIPSDVGAFAKQQYLA
jgi:uncharacterized membrane protein YozB (DUF420 family)